VTVFKNPLRKLSHMLVSGTLTADQVHEVNVFLSVETVAVIPEMFHVQADQNHIHKISGTCCLVTKH
jgi:hypothetical protein